MDHTSTVPPVSLFVARLKNFVASGAVVALALVFFRVAASNRKILNQLYGSTTFSFTGAEFLSTAALVYTELLALYFLTERDPGVSKSLRFWQVSAAFIRSPAVFVRRGWSREERVAVLATLLKALFGPLMGMALMTATMGFIANGAAIAESSIWSFGFREVFDRHGYWLLLQLIILIDLLIF